MSCTATRGGSRKLKKKERGDEYALYKRDGRSDKKMSLHVVLLVVREVSPVYGTR